MGLRDIALARGQESVEDGLKLVDIQPMFDRVTVGQLPRAPENRSPAIWIGEDWLAAGFGRSELLVTDEEEKPLPMHPVTRAWRNPVGGRGPFCRAFVHDWVDGRFWNQIRRTGLGTIRELEWLPRRRITIPQAHDKGRRQWKFAKEDGGTLMLRPSDFVSGAWDLDPDNRYGGLSPLRKIDSIIRLDHAVTQYVSDAFLRSGGKGLMFTVPTLADVRRFKTTEERAEYRREVQDSIRETVTGQHRGDPLITDGETVVSEYGVDISEVDVSNFWERCYEIEMAIFQIPPASAGLRIGRDPTYANARQWASSAFEQGLLPRFRDFVSMAEPVLLSETERNNGRTLKFQTVDADRAALEDQLMRDRLVLDRVREGIMGIVEGRKMLGDIDETGNEGLVMDLQQAQIIRLFGLTLQIPLENSDLGAVIAEAARVGVAPQQMGPEMMAQVTGSDA